MLFFICFLVLIVSTFPKEQISPSDYFKKTSIRNNFNTLTYVFLHCSKVFEEDAIFL